MKSITILTLLSLLTITLAAGIVITRDEMGFASKELYHQGYYAELIHNRIVQLWDFNKFEMTLIDHDLQIYTTVDFETFKTEMLRQNQAQIDSELRRIPPDTRRQIAAATMTVYNNMDAKFMLADTTRVHGHLAYEYHIHNGDIPAQKLWISKSIQELIDKEVNPIYIKRVENILKENRDKFFEAMGIEIDPITDMVEAIEEVGYIVKRIDYGLRRSRDPEFEKERENAASTITSIEKVNIDPLIFTFHQRYRRLSYSAYQMAVMRAMEEE